MKGMHAVIYAAGVGRRLEQQFGDMPKILLEFGGRSLLEWHVIRLIECRVVSLHLVLGYQDRLVQQAIEELKKHYALPVTHQVNERFEEGSLLSLIASLPTLEQIKGPGLLMDGDVLYPAVLLRRLIHSPHPTALLIDRNYSDADDDPVLVPIRRGRPIDFVKRWRGEADQTGESVGFFKLFEEDMVRLIGLARKQEPEGDVAASYDDLIRELVQAGRFGHEDVTGLPWTEIDFPTDVERARREIMPAIEQVSGQDNF